MLQRTITGALLSVIAGIALGADGVPSGPRSALLIGNAKYSDFTLAGVTKSLDQVEAALAKQEFQVQRKENLKEQEFKSAVEKYASSVPTNGVVVIYYAGLGAHVNRQGRWYNLLRPIDAKIASDNDYRSRGVNLKEHMLQPLEEVSGSRVNLVFLDACWESPLLPKQGSVFGGLTEFEVAPHSVVMFAAGSKEMLPVAKGEAASPMARSLASHFEKFNASIDEGCSAIAGDLKQAWVGGASQKGIGVAPALPVTDTLSEGNSPGQGFVNSIGMSFRWCPPGEFTMGSNDTNDAATRDRKPVQVKLTKGFWMGEHEVTQREYYAVMRKTVPIGFTAHNNAPFWGISETKQITEFCKKLSDMDRKAGTLPNSWEYICPTEAEWEYACRAGSSTRFCFGDSPNVLGQYGNFADKALHAANPNYHWAKGQSDDGVAEALAPVGSYLPNAWGLRDMHGNVAELVADHHAPELPGGTDPVFKVEKDAKAVLRGGAWCSLPAYCESSFRNASSGRDKYNHIGFRIALKRK